MIDITLLRTDPERIAQSMARRGIEIDLDELVGLDEQIRKTRHAAETVRSEQKEAGQRIAPLSGRSNVDTKRMSVDFPEPLAGKRNHSGLEFSAGISVSGTNLPPSMEPCSWRGWV